MTDNEMRVVIAEECGYQCVHSEIYSDGNGNFEYGPRGMPPHSNLRVLIPDYLSDLNAMHEAEKALTITLPPALHTESQRTRYVDWLSEMCGSKGMCMATARQRAEAFLRTIGKWKES